ncbi:MAG TPA: FG-GAP-like repeat-containing protein [Candidatus Acidoferrum sp.]|nr:FG-GAP-like repeat-containing protein [Candidatus Acidoferrum sp.]
MNRRDFIKETLLSAAAIWEPALSWNPDPLAPFLGFQHDSTHPAQPNFPDLAQYEEAKHPLFAGRFDEALKTLIPAVKERPGVVPYAVATIYLRMERYTEGIPYALQACRDTPGDIRYRWMLRTLTLHAGQPETSIPKEFRLEVPATSPSTFQFRDVTDSSHAGRLALGRGAAWGDFDNDGREDILVGAERAPFCLFHNRGDGTFEDVAPRMGLIDPVGLGCYASQFIDYDNDGFQDIFLTSNGWGGGGRLFLFHNEAGKRFIDVTESAGLGAPVNAFGSSWADYDNDGRVDLAVATGIIDPEGGGRIRLYHNEGNGRFREIGEQAGLVQRARWISLAWGDYDGDGCQDLLATSFDAGPFLFRNLGNGRFAEVSVQAGIRTQTAAYTPVWFDYNNDGKLDFFVCTYPGGELTVKDMIEAKVNGTAVPQAKRQLLFRNNGDGTFRNVTEDAGITGWYGGMSTQVGDFDNDGFDEITIGTGNPELDWTEPKPLFHNDGKGYFTNIADSAKLVHFGMLHGTALADYDDSGNLSLFGSFGGFYWGSRETSRLYRNSGSGNSSLEIRLIGTRSNRDAIGAKVSAWADARGVFKWVNGGNSFGCNNSRLVHLGLGRASQVKRLQIEWPSGLRQSFRDIPAGQRIEIIEGRENLRLLAKFQRRFTRP